MTEIESLQAELSPARLAQLDHDLRVLELTLGVVPAAKRAATARRIARCRRQLEEFKVLAQRLQWEVVN